MAGNSTVKFKVTYGTAVSSVYTAAVATSNPGIFTTSSNGQGQGAILNQDYSANSTSSSSTKAAVGSTVMIFASGLGTPNSTATDTAGTGSPTYPTGCVSPANYMAAVNAGTFTGGSKPGTAWTTLDGAVILGSNVATNKFAPCMVNSGTSAVTVTIGGKTATVGYAGWVANPWLACIRLMPWFPRSHRQCSRRRDRWRNRQQPGRRYFGDSVIQSALHSLQLWRWGLRWPRRRLLSSRSNQPAPSLLNLFQSSARFIDTTPMPQHQKHRESAAQIAGRVLMAWRSGPGVEFERQIEYCLSFPIPVLPNGHFRERTDGRARGNSNACRIFHTPE